MDIDLAALRAIERDREIPTDYLTKTLEDALLNAYQKTDNPFHGVRVEIDRRTGRVAVLALEFDDDDNVIGFYGDIPADLRRVAAAAARQVILRRIRETEDDQKYGHFSNTEDDILAGIIQAGRDSRAAQVDLGSFEAIIPQAEQAAEGEHPHGKRFKIYVASVRRESRGPQVVVPRTHPNLARKLFALEVPEVVQDIAEIKEVTREAGRRFKVVISSKNPDVSAKRAYIGSMGWRARATADELSDEKIDIVDWSEDPRCLTATALSPVKVLPVTVTNEATHTCRATVPDYQPLLVIGREGQNVRLAARPIG